MNAAEISSKSRAAVADILVKINGWYWVSDDGKPNWKAENPIIRYFAPERDGRFQPTWGRNRLPDPGQTWRLIFSYHIYSFPPFKYDKR